MTLADDTRAILVLEAFAAEATRIAAEKRAEIAQAARAQLARDGVAPSWTLPAIAKVTLGLTKEAVEVADAGKLLAWVAQRMPSEIEEILQVRPAYVRTLIAQVKTDGDLVFWPETGEIVPGLAVRPGGRPKGLTITAQPGIKAAIATGVSEMLGTAHAAITAPTAEAESVAAEVGVGDPFALFPPTTSGGEA